ncbi:unnamed protein product [Rotaria sordida]|uniref:Helitron helicase-like domain-containing protein n=1 Tax=Rotaria sordida TaxID=392033 RepID=A0A813XLS8_9BILA|nr:unnamed protein product [Rotaria sordida]
MPVLAEATCAICNVRIPIQQSKKVSLSKIPNIHLLKVSDELKNLITNGPSSLSQHLDSLYPTLFCYGRGVLEDQSRPVKVNLREHMRYLLSYNDRRFETNHSFIFVVFKLLQRRDACFHAQLIATKSYFRVSADEIQSLKSKDIEMALDNISKKTYSSESSSALNKLSHHIKTIGGRVMDSAYSHTALCTRIHALIYDQGLPSIFLTLNPADIHSPVALYFAGVKLDLDNIQMEQLMDNYKRAEIIASHPARCRNVDKLASAALSEAALALIPVAGETKSSLNRLRRETTPPLPKSSFFDVPDAYSVTINGTPFLFSDTLVRKKRVILFASDEQLLPRSWNTPPRLSRDNIYAALSTIDLTGLQQNIYGPNNIISTPLKEQFVSSILHVSALSNKLLQTPTRNQPTFVINASYNESKVIPACLQTPNSSSPNFASRFRADVVQLVEASNIHKHSDTCYKYWNTNKDDKKSCRMRMPRKLVPISTIDPDTAHYIRKKMNTSDFKYSSESAASVEKNANQQGRPHNERFPFQQQHPHATTHLMMKYSQLHVPIFYGPQIPRQDRDDTRERYCRALLTLFVSSRSVTNLCDTNQTWKDAFKYRQHLISVHSWKIIENIQLLHECKKDRDDHLLQVISEAQVDNDTINPVLLLAKHDVHGEYDMDDSDDLLELLGNLDEYTTTAVNTTRKTTENKYIEETIEAVENVGRFNHTNTYYQSSSDISIDRTNRQLIPFPCAIPHLVQLNTK